MGATSDHDAIVTSPQQEPPTYSQAVKDTGMGLLTSDLGRAQITMVYHASSTSNLSCVSGTRSTMSSWTMTDSGATSDESSRQLSKSNLQLKEEGTGSPLLLSSGMSELKQLSDPGMSSPSITRAERNMARTEEQKTSTQNHKESITTNSSSDTYVTATESEVKSARPEEGCKTSESSKTEFVRHYGSSTVMNPSPTHSPNQSRPFNGHNISIGKANSREVVVGSSEKPGDNNSVEERNQRQEDAIDDSFAS